MTDQTVANERKEAAKKALQERHDAQKKALQERREEQKKDNEKAMKRMDESKPTPTQEENDLARLGVPVDEKEDDKSGETVIEKRIVANQPLGYQTRSTKVKTQE